MLKAEELQKLKLPTPSDEVKYRIGSTFDGKNKQELKQTMKNNFLKHQ